MMGKLCNRDGTKCAYPSPYKTSLSGHWCAEAVSKYISVALGYGQDECRIGHGVQASGLIADSSGIRAAKGQTVTQKGVQKYGFELIYIIPAGTTRAQRQQWTRENALPGDVACMYKDNYSFKDAIGHVCMYSGDKWVSDFGQPDMYVYNTRRPR